MRIRKSGIEYVSHHLNYAKGRCIHGCVYCYNQRWNWAKGPFIVDMDFAELHKQLEKFKPEGDILLCSGHDPLGGYSARLAFCRIMEILQSFPEVLRRVRILTKGWADQEVLDALASEYYIPYTDDGYLLRGLVKFGVSITTLDEKVAQFLEPGATTIGYRLQLLKVANDFGYKTWISAEPMLRGSSLKDLLDLVPFVSEVWIGRLNHRTHSLALSDDELYSQLNKLSGLDLKPKIFLKEEVYKRIPKVRLLDFICHKRLNNSKEMICHK